LSTPNKVYDDDDDDNDEDPDKHRNVRDNHLVLYTDTADGILITSTVPVVEGSGWTTFSAIVWRQVLHIVDTTAGAFTTADTAKIYLSRATLVLLQTVCSSLHYTTIYVEIWIQLNRLKETQSHTI